MDAAEGRDAVTLIVVNGVERELRGDPARSLLVVLREELGLTAAKYGCAEGECGACTVLIDGAPVRSCIMPIAEVAGRPLTTLEGLAGERGLHPVQRAFLDAGAMQCGYCTPGMILAAVALLGEKPNPSKAEIREALKTNVCRCCTYPRIVDAVQRAAGVKDGNGRAAADDHRPASRDAEAEEPPEPLAVAGAPWDLRSPEERDYFDALGDGLVVVLPPGASAPGMWSTTGGAWVHVSSAGTVTAFTGKVDVGQDNRTALLQLVAEEVRVPLGSVRLVMGDTDICPFDMGTFGSRSMPDAGVDLLAAASFAREVLVAAAAKRWDADAGELSASGGSVRDRDGERTIAFADLVQGSRWLEVASGNASVRPPTAWDVAGYALPNVRAAEIVTGSKRFPSDVTRPGALFGAVLRPPWAGATLRSVDISGAQRMTGVTAVHDHDFVGVAGPDIAATRAAMRAVSAEWATTPLPREEALEEHLRSHPVESEGWGGSFRHETGDVDTALAAAAVCVTETYTTAYLAHVPLEPRSAVAEWNGGRLTVWTGTQRPFGVRGEVAEALGIVESRVRVIVPDAGAGFGGKHTGEVAIEAARLARASGRPVKVQWSRTEEFTCGYVRPAAVVDVRSGTDVDGRLTAWEFTNVNSGSPGILSPYDIPNQRIEFRPADSPLRQGSYRALAATANHFARESHVDEVAHRVSADPLEFRLRHLTDERLADVFHTAAERAEWSTGGREPSRGLGIAGGVEKDARVATVADVRVERDGTLEVCRLVTAFECGAIVNPGNLENQIEGATIMGLGGALFESVHFDERGIVNDRLSQYRVPRFSDVPPIDVVLVDRRDVAPAGAGETPIVAVAPAIANAVFAASGKRIRSMPLAPDGVVA